MGTDRVENALSERSLSRRGFAKNLGAAVLGTAVGAPLIGGAQTEAAGAAEGLNPTAVKTRAYTAAPGDYVPVNIENGSVAIKLPSAPLGKTRIGIQVVAVSGTPGSTTVTINRGGSDVFNIAGGSTSLTLSAKFQSVLLQYNAGIWYVQSTDTPLNQALGSAQLGKDATVGGEGGSALSSSVVYSSGAILLHPETFGATPSGDSTAAFIAMTEHIEAKKYGNVAILLGAEYALNSAPIHSHDGNAIWPLGKVGAPACNVAIICAPGGTNISSSVTGQTYSSSYGPPSIIGGPTNEQVGKAGGFCPWDVTIVGSLVVFAGENPSICGVDLQRVGFISVNGSLAAVAGWVYTGTGPTHKYTYGVRLPEGGNSGRVAPENLYIQGFYTGVVANSAHLCGQLMSVSGCVIGLGMVANEQFAGNDGHVGTIQHLLIQACAYHIAGWSPTQTEPISPPATAEGKGRVSLYIHLFDTENDGSGWTETKINILDEHNEFFGSCNYQRWDEVLQVTGARNFATTDVARRWQAFTYNGTKTEASGLGESTGCQLKDGRVYLRGAVYCKETVGGQMIATLPAGLTPTKNVWVNGTVSAGGETTRVGLEILENGEIYVREDVEEHKSISIEEINFGIGTT
jgi:hypothetical protein